MRPACWDFPCIVSAWVLRKCARVSPDFIRVGRFYRFCSKVVFFQLCIRTSDRRAPATNSSRATNIVLAAACLHLQSGDSLQIARHQNCKGWAVDLHRLTTLFTGLQVCKKMLRRCMLNLQNLRLPSVLSCIFVVSRELQHVLDALVSSPRTHQATESELGLPGPTRQHLPGSLPSCSSPKSASSMEMLGNCSLLLTSLLAWYGSSRQKHARKVSWPMCSCHRVGFHRDLGRQMKGFSSHRHTHLMESSWRSSSKLGGPATSKSVS